MPLAREKKGIMLHSDQYSASEINSSVVNTSIPPLAGLGAAHCVVRVQKAGSGT